MQRPVEAYSYDEETLSTTAFVYWDWHLIAELNVAWNGTVSRKRHYVWGLDKEGVRPGAGGVGGLLMVVDNVTNKTYLAMNDYIGNVIGLLDPDTGSTVAEYEYDPFGRTIRATGTFADKNPIRFSSQYTDNETGLVYFGFRYYHPQWGRFINRDPIEEPGGENLYRFVSNDPVNRWDLLGLSTQGSGWRIDEWRRAVGIRTGGIINYDNPQSGRSSGSVSQTNDKSSSSGESSSSAADSSSGEPSAGQAQEKKGDDEGKPKDNVN